ncbi:hypothetical protein A2803_04300 [Candidatus Woesebacteria bacterium RIFCSPHIGHO2_01_FULL_44_21]|uniref:DUF5678 domain-containing protein n=1 Tax=Candidatus Woesebacteria bacterium RIFCSPHIGHO2_01_FULL_44_21 TaxID=1802503 RepID=A0A1F7Z1B7_9BACT|nr:MAG: hypothetical protein A2803_04300 [Candidatus Woesebacteria bacterium RIFCSPHIGHO2_01_FULL_44_21]OGM71490.1 MAG: hypothetical protein A2897_04185 [Candidatus Woesebacteria bacterium RIFCSPLOWO2_01_FULL_44_24b]
MTIDLEKTIKKYGGKWVLIDDEGRKIVTSSRSAKSVYVSAKKRGYKTPHLFKVPTKLIPYIG